MAVSDGPGATPGRAAGPSAVPPPRPAVPHRVRVGARPGTAGSGSVPSGSVPSGSVPSGSVPSGSMPSGSTRWEDDGAARRSRLRDHADGPAARRSDRVDGDAATGGAGIADAADDPALSPLSGRQRTLLTGSLVALCLVVIDTAVRILPAEPPIQGVPVLDVLTTGRWLVLAGLVAAVIAAPRPATFRTAVDVPLLALVLVAAVATRANGQDLAPVRGLLTAVAVFYLTVAVVRAHPDAVPVLLATVLGSAFLAAAIGVQQFSQNTDTGFCRSGFTNSEECTDGQIIRVTGTFTNPNLLAGYLVATLPLAASLAFVRAARRLRLAVFLLVAVGLVGLVVTFSRGGLTAAVVIAGATLAVAVAGTARARRLAAPAMLAACAAGALLLAVLALSGVLSSASGRGPLWSVALAAARRGGIDGNGYGTAGEVMTVVSGTDLAHAHNLWLNWLVDVGPLGPVLVSLVVVLALAAGVQRAAGGSVVAIGASASILGVTIMSVLDHPTTVTMILTVFLVATAVAVALPEPPGEPAGRHAAADGDDEDTGDEAGPTIGTDDTGRFDRRR